MKTNEDIKQARDYGVQAFRNGEAAAAIYDPNLARLLNKEGADRLKLIQAWKAGWESAYKAEFV